MKYEELKLRFETKYQNVPENFSLSPKIEIETKETEPDDETRRIKNEILQESDEWKRRNEK